MSFTINDYKVKPGEKAHTMLRVAQMLNGSDLQIPVHVIRGRQKGLVLGLFACIHGSEYYQNRVIRRLVNETDPAQLKGTIIALPVANPYAFMHMSRETPNPPEETVDFANMNRVFPGKRSTPLFGSMESTDVSLTMKMAAALSDHVIPHCTHILDYHGQMKGMALKKMLFNLDPETVPLLELLGHRYKVGLITNWEHGPKIHRMIDELGVRHLFHDIVVSDDVGAAKPDPEIYRVALRRLGVQAPEAVYVGDMDLDAQGALDAGMHPVLIRRTGGNGSWSSYSSAVECSYDPDDVACIECLGELPRLLTGG